MRDYSWQTGSSEKGKAVEEKQTSQAQAARRIQALLAMAEDAAKANNEELRDTYLDKASALQLKFAIADAMLRTEDREGIEQAEFCRESNTPLIKAKRELIGGLALLYRGKAVLMSELQPRKDGRGLKVNKRASIRVFAHASDLRFIQQMYTSLILQMQSMMAADEKVVVAMPDFAPAGKVTNAWRVSYAYGWVQRVYSRLAELKERQEREETSGQPGTALVLADRTALVVRHVADNVGKLRKANYRRDDNRPDGHRAGRAAGDRADLGQKKVSNSGPRQLEA